MDIKGKFHNNIINKLRSEYEISFLSLDMTVHDREGRQRRIPFAAVGLRPRGTSRTVQRSDVWAYVRGHVGVDESHGAVG